MFVRTCGGMLICAATDALVTLHITARMPCHELRGARARTHAQREPEKHTDTHTQREGHRKARERVFSDGVGGIRNKAEIYLSLRQVGSRAKSSSSEAEMQTKFCRNEYPGLGDPMVG